MFACEHEEVEPDLMCVAKGLTGGYLPLSATFATQEIYNAFLGDPSEGKTFYHGHTYTGNPLACAAAIASLDLFQSTGLLKQVTDKSRALAGMLNELRSLPHVGDIRQKGFMVGIELVKDKSTREPFDPALRIGAKICTAVRKHGVILRPLGDVIVMMPPLAMNESQLKKIVDAVAISKGQTSRGIEIAESPPACGLSATQRLANARRFLCNDRERFEKISPSRRPCPWKGEGENEPFITATDTDVGKTVIAGAIAHWFARRKFRVGVFKPVATGCPRRREGLISEDAEFLAHCADAPGPLDLICPQRYAEPLAPAVAAERAGQPLDWGAIDRALREISDASDVMIVEGVGGIMAPLDPKNTGLDLARRRLARLPTIAIVAAGRTSARSITRF